MRVYAVADIHGRIDRFDRIQNNLSNFKADILVLAGDITNYTKPKKFFSRLNALPVPVLAIRGNSDLKRVDHLFQTYSNCIPIHVINCAFNSTNSGALIVFENQKLASIEMI